MILCVAALRWTIRALPAFVEAQKSQKAFRQLLATPSSDTKASIGLAALEQARVEEIMVPKAEIIGIDLEQPWHKILEEIVS